MSPKNWVVFCFTWLFWNGLTWGFTCPLTTRMKDVRTESWWYHPRNEQHQTTTTTTTTTNNNNNNNSVRFDVGLSPNHQTNNKQKVGFPQPAFKNSQWPLKKNLGKLRVRSIASSKILFLRQAVPRRLLAGLGFQESKLGNDSPRKPTSSTMC